MEEFNLDAVACPHCGTSGSGHLNASSQIEFTGHADGEEWVTCPDCGAHVDFTEDGEITDHSGAEEIEWQVNIDSALGGDA